MIFKGPIIETQIGRCLEPRSKPDEVLFPCLRKTVALAHLWAIPAFCWFGYQAHLGVLYYVGVGLVAVVLFFEHRVIQPDDPARVNMAFFTMNGVVSLVMLGCTLLDIYAF